MEKDLPIPSNWQDFEDLCLRLWNSIWGRMGQKVGRGGQDQHGIDIIGKSFLNDELHGIQCKRKGEISTKQLEVSEIDEEIKKAKGFDENLKHLTFATTAPRDIKLQQYCLKLNESSENPFDVDVWSWQDIQSEVQYREDIMKHFYKEYSVEYDDTAIYDVRFSFSHLAAFFSRDSISRLFSTEQQGLLSNLAYELFDNAYNYGRASKFTLKVEDDRLYIIDNGKEYNSLLLTGERGGAVTLKKVKETFQDIKYEYVDRENRISLSLPDKVEESEIFEFSFGPSFSRKVEMPDIPSKAKKIIINMTSNMPYSSARDIFEIFENMDKEVTVYLRHDDYFFEDLKKRYPDINFIKR